MGKEYADGAGGVVVSGACNICLQRFGVPPLAKRAAFALPQSVEARLGEDTLSALDKMIFKPSRLTQEKQAELAVCSDLLPRPFLPDRVSLFTGSGRQCTCTAVWHNCGY